MSDPDALLTRIQAVDLLNEHGFPIKLGYLTTMVSRGGGPPFRKFGQRALYRRNDVIEWAKNRLGPPVNSTSANDAER